MKKLQSNIGYTFKDKELLKKALTHTSYAYEHGVNSNEKLEFLGDSILEFISSIYLYENYKNILDIAEENQDKSFVYVYDNFFNHMQSVSEMMIYNRTLIINVNNNDELHCVIDDDSLNTEDSYILSIKSYMDNDSILDRIKNESEFKNITLLYKAEDGNNSNVVMDNLYLVSK